MVMDIVVMEHCGRFFLGVLFALCLRHACMKDSEDFERNANCQFQCC